MEEIMAKLYNLIIDIMQKGNLAKYGLTVADVNGLIYLYNDIVRNGKADTIQTAVYNFIVKNTELKAEPKGIGWTISK